MDLRTKKERGQQEQKDEIDNKSNAEKPHRYQGLRKGGVPPPDM